MHKIIFIFKENMEDLLITFVVLTLILTAVLSPASAQEVPTKTSICKEIEKGRYQNLDKLLKPTSSLRDINLNNNGEAIYNGQQIVELISLETECGMRLIPINGLVIEAMEDIENIYTKYFKVR